MLGRLSARRGDRVVTRFASSRTAALLARLAFFPERAHPREELIGLLWPEDGLDAGRPRLRVVLASLRRQMEPPDVPPGSVLVADRSALRLGPDACRSDVAEFEAALQAARRAPSAGERRDALDRALALYAGELLPGFYDDWIVAERGRLESLYEDACDRRRGLSAAGTAGEQVGEAAGEPGGTAPPPDLRGFPLQFTRLFGHEEESARVAGWLRRPLARLVTLTGPGGAGKTRLAAHAARSAADGRAGPVCFVPLADLADARLIPDAILGALAVPRSATVEPLEQAVAALAGMPPALLVLDNFEHLVERGAPLVSALLTRLPALTCLVTSRRRLALPGEREYPVPPLPLPDAGGTAAEVARAASAQLFVDRAQAARPDFQLTAGNAAAVAGLCRSLEGIPLAIELVAGWAMTLTPAQMTERLAQRFALLHSRRGDKGTRHRSLWAALEWSHDLLPPDLGRFFAQLSVFRGGTAEAAQAVCEQPQALEFLTQLRERSLLVMEDSGEAAGEERRFRLLETLREFGAEHLAGEERQPLARRHALWFLGFTEEAAPRLTGPEQARWLDRLEADHENLRRALAWWLAEDGAVDEALRMAGALWRFWVVRGHYAEGRAWLEQALARRGEPSEARARAANGAGNLASEQADYPAAAMWYTEALELMRGLGHTAGVSACLCNLGRVAMHRGDYGRAQALQEEALVLRRESGDKGGIAYTLQCLGFVAQHLRDHARARRLHEESLALWREVGNDGGRMWSLCNLGSLAGEAGDDAAAARLYAEALGLCLALGDRRALYELLGTFAALAARRGGWVRAAALAGASESLRRRTGAGIHANEAADLHAALAPARDGLSGGEYAAAWAAGEALTAEQAVAYALEDHPPADGAGPP